ncbi:NADPH:quinone oxidoreductase family protein [Salipiger abyssi]|uniref:NADPH:quinone oxidoreductase family protein n=1 Tax=Salipiger abyssi TaxID=1250539 RepID=UPI001A9073CD|nr:NADPH:quinone oxidoreductase family protein [Salipiger abyssi]MBN9887168.1 NADPH:quinone oxidoreductase family protein [Salipiger abyssi]
MKILLSENPGGPERLTLATRPQPEPGPGEIRISVRCVGINYPDTLIIEDRYQFRPERPFAPGAELCGVVETLGDGVTGFAPGDRVMALTVWGALAEKVCVPAAQCHPVPDAVSDADAASLQMTYGTALHALEERGGLRPGETVVVLGAAGGVGMATVELAKLLGARVVAAASSAEKCAAARACGSDATVIYPRGPLDRTAQKAFAGALREAIGPEGADIVVDIVGGDYSEPALRCMGFGGRFLIVGFPAGIARIPANLPLLKSCDIRGVFWGAAVERAPEANRRAMARLLELCAEGKIRPRIHATYPLTEGARAIAALNERTVMGKVLVTV